MTPKSEKDTKSTNKKKTVTKAIQSKPSSKSTKKIEEDDFDFNEEDMETLKSSKKSTFPKSTKKITDDDEEDEVEDDWTKVDEVDSSWDPDFEEFDIPKSKNKNKAGGLPKKRKRREEEDDDYDFSMDDDFKDLNNDSLDEEDDLY